MAKNMIGLDETQAKSLAEQLNDLLANYQIFYMNVRGYHWNIKGEKFFELHAKFEELYDDLLLKIDEIAERVLTLGFQPTHTYSDYLKDTTVPERSNVSDGIKAVNAIVEGFAVLLEKQRSILSAAGDAGDEGTVSLMSDYITSQEKLVWMYRSFLGE